jgi:hypothetical protein
MHTCGGLAIRRGVVQHTTRRATAPLRDGSGMGVLPGRMGAMSTAAAAPDAAAAAGAADAAGDGSAEKQTQAQKQQQQLPHKHSPALQFFSFGQDAKGSPFNELKLPSVMEGVRCGRRPQSAVCLHAYGLLIACAAAAARSPTIAHTLFATTNPHTHTHARRWASSACAST